MIWNDPVDLSPLGRFPPGVHFRPRGEHTVLGIWTHDAIVEEPRFPPRFDRRFPEIVVRGLADMIPALVRYASRAGDAVVDGGYYCKAPDNRPLIGPVAVKGMYLLGALSGFGVMASQAAAELLAAWVLDRARPEYAAAFSGARFLDPAYRSQLLTIGTLSGQL
jgi:glycine/D-amino acid oxidase-like deaminating enzyme